MSCGARISPRGPIRRRGLLRRVWDSLGPLLGAILTTLAVAGPAAADDAARGATTYAVET